MQEDQIRARMGKVLENVSADVGTLRTGRATSSLVSEILVSVYGGQQKLRIVELATITATDPYSLLISPWDKSIIGEIRRGIEALNLGFTPVLTGEEIRINFPPLTQEDRARYVKLLHQKLEEGRIQLRQARQEGMKDIKAAGEQGNQGGDETIRQEKRLQEITDEFMGKIEEVGQHKESELRSL